MKITTQDLSTISDIYDVVLNPDQWTKLLDRFDQRLNIRGSNLFVSDNHTGQFTSFYVSTNLLPVLKYYLEKKLNRMEEEVLPVLHEIISEQRFMSIREVYRRFNEQFDGNIDTREFEQWAQENFELYERYTSPLNFSPAFRDFITFHFTDVSDTEIKKSLNIASTYLPHIAKAVELTRPFTLLKSRFNAVLEVLDRFHLGVTILNTKGIIVLFNQSAQRIIESKDGIMQTQARQLRAIDAEVDIALQKALYLTSKVSAGADIGKAIKLSVPRRCEAVSYLLEISPLTNSEMGGSTPFAGTLIIMIDPGHRQIIDTSGLDLLFELTKAEKQVCDLLVSGYTTGEIAEERGTSIETIRKQVAALLNKTNSARRSELVRLALSINIPVDQPDK